MTISAPAAVRGAAHPAAKDGIASLTSAGGASSAAPGPFSDSLEAERCRALWLEVLNRAIADVTKGTPDWQAVAWFRNGSADFRTVCWLAGMEPEAIRERILAHLDGSRPIVPSATSGRQAVPAERRADLVATERTVLAYHAAHRASNQAIADACGVSAYFVTKVLGKHGVLPHRVRSGTAYKARHDEIVAAKKRGGQASAAKRKKERDQRMAPLRRMLAANPGLSVKAAATACGIGYSAAKTYMRALSAEALEKASAQVAGETSTQRTVVQAVV